MWEVEYTDEFERWWNSLDKYEQGSITSSVGMLKHIGPNLPRPYADSVRGSRYPNMKELRTQHNGRPFRTFFAFNPKRNAILLIGGNKSGDKRFYEKMVPKADRLYAEHLIELKKEAE